MVKKPGQLFTYQKEVRIRKQFEQRDLAINSGKNDAAFAAASTDGNGESAEKDGATDAAGR